MLFLMNALIHFFYVNLTKEQIWVQITYFSIFSSYCVQIVKLLLVDIIGYIMYVCMALSGYKTKIRG